MTRERQLCWVLLAFSALLIFGRVHLPLLKPEETRNADVAREMAANQSWLIPLFEGKPYLDKPPLLYWLVAASEAMFGASNSSARLVTTIAAWLTVMVVYWWGRAVADAMTGLIAAGVLTLTGDFVYRGPMLTMNGLMGLFVTASLAAGHASLQRESRQSKLWFSAALFTALGILVKGPVALVLVMPPMLLAPYWDKSLRKPRIIDWLSFGLLAVLVAAPWFVAVAIRDPDFFEYFFMKHNVQRFVQPFDHAKPFWSYLPQIAYGWLPWTVVAGVALFSIRSVPRPAVVGLVAVSWGVLFFSLSGSKRPAYLVPIEPAFAIAVGVMIREFLRDPATGLRRIRIVAVIAGVTACVMLVGVFAWLPRYSEHFGRNSG